MVMLNLYFGPVCHSYLLPYFWTFWSIMGCSTAASTEWSQDLKQVTAMLRAARCMAEGNTARYFTGRRRNTDRSGQILALRKSSDCREFCKPEISVCMGRKTLTLNTNMKPPCDNLEVNPCHVHVIGVRICLKGLLQMAILMLPRFPLSVLKTGLSVSAISVSRSFCGFFYLLWFWGKTLEVSVTESVPHLVATRKYHGDISHFGIGKTVDWHLEAKHVVFLLSLASLGLWKAACIS